MSESVKIGGIGKNPVIDKINRLDSMDVKSYAVDTLESLLISERIDQNTIYSRAVPLDFGGICKGS